MVLISGFSQSKISRLLEGIRQLPLKSSKKWLLSFRGCRAFQGLRAPASNLKVIRAPFEAALKASFEGCLKALFSVALRVGLVV